MAPMTKLSNISEREMELKGLEAEEQLVKTQLTVIKK